MVKTVGEVVRELSGTAMDQALLTQVGQWPADLFAITSAILAESGAYRLVVSPPANCKWPLDKSPGQWGQTIKDRADA